MKIAELFRRAIPKSWLQTKVFDPLENIDLNKVVGWRTIGGSSAFGYYHDKQYENGYSSISKLANGFARIEPYTIDGKANPVESNLLNRLYTPNTDMSAYDFREALMVTTLVHDRVRLKVHHKGVRINAESITGFTFMEDYIEDIIGGKRIYKMPNGETLTDDEVVTLKSINPDNITGGFSPSRAAHRWTKLDDYLADYQKGFFENGAVPSGQMIITARTATEFNDIVDTLQAKHKGASKNNNITYTHRPTDGEGKALNSQIEWVPFSTANKDMALKDLFDNVNKKIDSVYGVPEEIRGHLSNSNYASVAVAEKVFVKYALDPLTLKIWSKFTHELNRITGGMGVAVTYDLEIPKIADEEKVKAEAKQVDATTIKDLTTEGYTLESAIDYVKTGNIDALKLGRAPQKEKPDVLSPEEAKGTPDQPLDIYSKRFDNVEKLLKNLSKTKSNQKPVATKQIGEADRELYEFKYQQIVMENMTHQVDKAIIELDKNLKSKAYGDTSETEDKVFTAAILALMLPLMNIYGNKAVALGVALVLQAGLKTEDIDKFEFTPAQRKAYEQYVSTIAKGYNQQTAEQIRQIVGQGVLDGLSKAEIEDQLRTVILGPENQYRVRRLAVSEINTAESKASLSAMQSIQSQTGYNLQKKKTHFGSDAPCEFCQTFLSGDWINVDDDYAPLGAEVKGTEGGIYVNNWRDFDCGDVHANGHCGEEFRVLRG